MKITILAVGKLKEAYFAGAVKEYSKRLGRYCRLEVIEVMDERTAENASGREEDLVRQREGERLKKYIKEGAYVISLAIEGQQHSSEDFAQKLHMLGLHGKSHIIFIIGGSIGLAPEILKDSDELLSFSKMTFPHQLMRVVLLEQIYRAYRIIHGEPYHK
ncbi:MAG: 23S rRNA (pseudouridine(1915)-N(3))-methyltransferase RlmH [Lachnospiraceae bacterium]|jgi:rRNA large subunit m3Psi methyltransferase RlmH|nr:23S rRNA (pseudouridine(1915)-N(3))-methyltransferase RlmH [Lachnospiraceae bacterium]RKI25959.1 23S rRNA (pseudouridine(1915)-N(3))-methyltransferase RlmH [bacterium D16-36]RKI68102.1 23S rRNA (pseudouridine(1915)-N(3))-methyltransferase RlmH [bacterium 1xD8-6]